MLRLLIRTKKDVITVMNLDNRQDINLRGRTTIANKEATIFLTSRKATGNLQLYVPNGSPDAYGSSGSLLPMGYRYRSQGIIMPWDRYKMS